MGAKHKERPTRKTAYLLTATATATATAAAAVTGKAKRPGRNAKQHAALAKLTASVTPAKNTQNTKNTKHPKQAAHFPDHNHHHTQKKKKTKKTKKNKKNKKTRQTNENDPMGVGGVVSPNRAGHLATPRSPRSPRSPQPSVYEAILREKYPLLSVRLNPGMQQTLLAKFGHKIPGSVRGDPKGGITYLELFAMFSGHDHKRNTPHMVFVKGGFVRDLILGKSLDDIADIDIVHTMPMKAVRYGKNGLNARNVSYTHTHQRYADKPDYIFTVIGHDVPGGCDQGVDCTHTTLPPYASYEVPANTLMINVTHFQAGNEFDRFYDITGCGYEHAQKKIWAAQNAAVRDDPAWLEASKLWRMFKFANRGYTIPTETKKAIYHHWLNHYSQIEDHVWANPWVKYLTPPAASASGVEGLHATLTPPAASASVVEGLHATLTHLFDTVVADLHQIGGTSKDAYVFCKMLLEKNLLTIPTRVPALKKIRTYVKTLKYTKNVAARLSSNVQTDSGADPEVIRLCAILKKLSGAKGCTPRHVFDYVVLLKDCNLITMFPIMTLQPKVPLGGVVFDHPATKTPTAVKTALGSADAVVFPLHPETMQAVVANLCERAVHTPPGKSGKSSKSSKSKRNGHAETGVAVSVSVHTLLQALQQQPDCVAVYIHGHAYLTAVVHKGDLSTAEDDLGCIVHFRAGTTPERIASAFEHVSKSFAVPIPWTADEATAPTAVTMGNRQFGCVVYCGDGGGGIRDRFPLVVDIAKSRLLDSSGSAVRNFIY